MKALSPRALDVLARLARPLTWRERLHGGTEDAVRALTELAALAEPALVPHVVVFVFSGPPAVRRAAATVVEHALTAASPLDLLAIDEACRRVGWAPATSEHGWRALTPARLAELETLGPAAWAALCVASCHANGYVREAAVARLDARLLPNGDGRELGMLLVRMNDWAPPVADRARRAVERRVTPAYALAWLRGLPLLLRLGAETRRPAGPLAERVLALLRAREQREVLLDGLASRDRTTRRAALSLIREAAWTTDARVDIVRRALGDADPIVRLQAIAFARERLSDAELERVLPPAFSDAHAPVRRRGLDTAVERFGAGATPWLERALLDRGASIRELARFALDQLDWPTPFPTFYRRQLGVQGPTHPLAAAVRGLGETGAASDAIALVPLLGHAHARVRVAVVSALVRLDAQGTIDLRLARLADPSRRVARAARETLVRQMGAIGPAAIRAALRDTPSVHGKLEALALASHLPKWESIVVLLEATAAPDPVVAASARAHVARWLTRQNQSFARPTAAELGALEQALEVHGVAVERVERRALQDLLRYWRSA